MADIDMQTITLPDGSTSTMPSYLVAQSPTLSNYAQQQASMQDPGSQLLPAPQPEAPKPAAPDMSGLVQPVSPQEKAEAAAANYSAPPMPEPAQPPQATQAPVTPANEPQAAQAPAQQQTPATPQTTTPVAPSPGNGGVGGTSINYAPIQRLVNGNVDLANTPILGKDKNGNPVLLYQSGKVETYTGSKEQVNKLESSPDQILLKQQEADALKAKGRDLKQETDAAKETAMGTWNKDLARNVDDQLAVKEKEAEETNKDIEKTPWERIAQDKDGKTTAGGVAEYIGRSLAGNMPIMNWFVDNPDTVQAKALKQDAAHLQTLKTQVDNIHSQFERAGKIGELDTALTYMNDYQTAAKLMNSATTKEEQAKALADMTKAKQQLAGVNQNTAAAALSIVNSKLEAYNTNLRAQQLQLEREKFGFEKEKVKREQQKLSENERKEMANTTTIVQGINDLKTNIPSALTGMAANSSFHTDTRQWFNKLNTLKLSILRSLAGGSVGAERSKQVHDMIEHLMPQPYDSDTVKAEKLGLLEHYVNNQGANMVRTAANPTATGAAINLYKANQ